MGYISFNVSTPGKEWVIYCSFFTGWAGTNRIGVQIRMTDGVTDALGRSANGSTYVTPTATITDLEKALSTEFCYSAGDKYQNLTSEASDFIVTGEFNNLK